MPVFSRKKELAELDVLDKEVVEAIPNLHENAEIIAAAERFHALQGELKRVIGELSQCSAECDSPQLRFNANSDAAALLQGASVKTLAGPDVTSRRATLQRQRLALETALPTAQCAITETECRVILSEMKKLSPIGQGLVSDTLGACQSLLDCLRREAQFYNLLSRQGFRPDRRGPQWSLWPLEDHLLFSGNGHPGLEFYIAQRRKSIGLPEKE